MNICKDDNMSQKERRKRHKKEKIARLCRLVNRYKTDKCCIKCGTKPAEVHQLEFHHRDPSTKTKTVSRGITTGWSIRTLTNEIRKCVLVCRGCHVETHKFLNIFKVC